MKKMFFVSFLFLLLLGCLSNNDILENYFVPIEETASIALEFSFYLRAIKTIPDNLFILNERTFKLYKLHNEGQDIFSYDNLPLGRYRLGYWTATSTGYKTHFRVFTFLNFIYDISKSGRYNLGIFTIRHYVDSLNVKKPTVNYVLLNLRDKKYFNYRQLPPKRERASLDRDILFERLDGYGKAFELTNEPDERVESSLMESINYFKYRIHKMLQAIDLEFSQKGINSALALLHVFNLDIPNINFLIKEAYLYKLIGDDNMVDNLFDRIKKIDPNCAQYYSYIGEKEYKAKNIEQASQTLYKAISLNTQNASSYELYANILLSKDENIALALALSNRALELSPNNLDYLKTNLLINKKLGNKKKVKKLTEMIERIK